MRSPIEKIPEGNYTGYYWLSDKEEPMIVNGNFPDELLEKKLPFIVEGNLYDADQKKSISIRHNGERHVIHLYDLSNQSGFEKNEVAFIPHRMPGKSWVKFLEIWKETPDPLCAGMITLQPYARVFTGFEANYK